MPTKMCLSSEEEKAVEELRVRMKNDLTPTLSKDRTLFYRFSKARDFNVDKAEKMLRKHIHWRKVVQADTILDDFKPIEFFKKVTEPPLIGFDKAGDLVRYSPAGRLNVSDMMKCVKGSDYLKHWVWFSEKHIATVKETAENTGELLTSSLIQDLDKLELLNATSKVFGDLVMRFSRLYQDNYPETMKAVYVINAPSFFVFIYSILSKVMSSATLQKFQVFGYSGWKEKLLEVIDADVLPAFLGGNRTDRDGNPLCDCFIPENYTDIYTLSNEERYFKDPSKVEKLTVPPSERKELRIEVKEAGSEIHWRFLVKGKDIGFGLFFEESEGDIKEIIPIEKIDTVDGTEAYFYKCMATGKYVIVFDNSYSWLSSKEIQYWISVLKPELKT